jgi:IclR family pca regulon transcriptional regulator
VLQVRRQGWCVVDQELEEGLISVAAPIHGPDGRMSAAINLSGQANRTNARAVQEQLLPPLLEAAQAIEQLLLRKKPGDR